MPKAARFHELGGPEVLRIEEVALREPGPGEVNRMAHDRRARRPCFNSADMAR